MEYTIQKLARLAGVSTRTLRYYDEIGLLKPARINSSGYRIYSQPQVNRLQQIMFYRELGLSLEAVKELMDSPSFDDLAALKQHHEHLLGKKQQLDLLIRNVESSIAASEGRIVMSNQDKFEGFKQKMVKENGMKYGEEIRQKYGAERVESSNQKLMNMSEAQYKEAVSLETEIREVLAEAMDQEDPSGPLAQQAAELHKRWLTLYWNEYSKEAHAGLAQMYVDDERFRAYYDAQKPGTAEFLRDAINIYTGTTDESR
ncbi:MerR family transcriptional regulator [Paenibacillus lemnae]|uniref:MerR family transcriptional regulator n=1 Tax=Paenibacillus lemnae TaxID=1330551 RepID=A0A848M8H6_PAELE|nr:MerR family transcriptional regulator [Paenibacillus lemnae]NMO97347.1 MerR family transcriptional regulator [Paenibacillus lemnae]